MSKNIFLNKVAVITGASSGIGRATAIELARHGANLVLAARRKNALEDVAKEIAGLNRETLVIPTDVSDQNQVNALISETIDKCGHIDIFIANAGEYVRRQIINLTKADFEHSFAVNFYGALYGVLAVLPHMIERKNGHIVLISSLNAKKSVPVDGPYAAAKCAITGFFEVLRQELKKEHVKVTIVYPGRIDTPFVKDMKFPWISPKIPAEKVSRAIVRGVKRNRTEMIVPGILAVYGLFNTLSPRFMDWIVRIFHLEGWQE